MDMCQGGPRDQPGFILPQDVEGLGVNKRMVVSKAVNAAAFAGNARIIVGRNPRVKPLIPLYAAVTRKNQVLMAVSHLCIKLPSAVPKTRVP